MATARLALRAAGLILRGKRADPTPDYDFASTGYDDFFTTVMGRHGLDALNEITIEPGNRIVELACGTGHLTEAAARQLDGRGSIRAVDMSSGMLSVASKRLEAYSSLDISLEQGDMLAFIERQPRDSADVVVCGWAICYTKPVKLLRHIRRVLVPGGKVVIIETRNDALRVLRDALEAVLASDPSMMTRMVHVSLPKNPDVLRRWFDQSDLKPLVLREGEQELPWCDADEAVEWVERSGAAAGFRDAIQSARLPELRTKLRSELHRRLSGDATLRLTHTFVVGVATRPSKDGE